MTVGNWSTQHAHGPRFFSCRSRVSGLGGALGGIYGSQIMAGEFNLMLSLFGIPFVLGTLFLGSIALMTVCGKVVVSTSYDQGKIFTGVGPFGWT